MKHKCISHDLSSNNLFFADDGAIHATSEFHLQRLVDVCHSWSIENGMIFAADKCLVLSKDKTNITMGNYVLPQVDLVTYLGIPFSSSGPDFNFLINSKCEKAEKATMMVVRSGLASQDWSYGIKSAVSKQFIRPILEYGLQLVVCTKKQLKILEKCQYKCVRLLMGLPKNQSALALKRLFCLESMQCRNHILNGRFQNNLSTLADNIPAANMFKKASLSRNSVAYLFRRDNIYSHEFLETNGNSRELIKSLRYKNIMENDSGVTGVGSDIYVDPSLKLY